MNNKIVNKYVARSKFTTLQTIDRTIFKESGLTGTSIWVYYVNCTCKIHPSMCLMYTKYHAMWCWQFFMIIAHASIIQCNVGLIINKHYINELCLHVNKNTNIKNIRIVSLVGGCWFGGHWFSGCLFLVQWWSVQ